MATGEQEGQDTAQTSQEDVHQSRERANQAREHVNRAREEVNQARENANEVREAANQAREDLRGRDAPITTAPPWVPDQDGQTHTLADGAARCRVWYAQGTWSAVITYGHASEASYNFRTFAEACAWCEAQIAEHR